jgi:hypothetical protein
MFVENKSSSKKHGGPAEGTTTRASTNDTYFIDRAN